MRKRIEGVRIKLILEPRDFWVGIYVSESKYFSLSKDERSIYILPLPMFGIKITYHWIV